MKNYALIITYIFLNLAFVGCMDQRRVEVHPAIEFLPSNFKEADSENPEPNPLIDLKETGLLNEEELVFYEDFEMQYYYRKWTNRDGRPIGVGTVTGPAEYVFSGKHSAVIINRKDTHESEGDGKFVPQEPIAKVAYVRLYLRLSDHFSMGSANGIKLFSIVGTRHHTYYKSAGHRPNGHDRYGATLAMDNWNEVFIYCYHPDQRSGYGDEFYKTSSKGCSKLQPGKWYCLELMLAANDIGKKNGQLKAWVDNELIIQIDRMRFRNTEDLKMWRFYVSCYFGGGSQRNTSPKDQYIFIDDYVISKARIGCSSR